MSMLAITYIGHATTLIEFEGVTLLTDPNFGKRVFFAKRIEPLTYDPGKLPDLSAIVISHAHLDHLNISSFKYIKSSVPVFVPAGLGRFISKFVKNPIIELNHWATHKLPGGTEITATEARHAGFRWTGLRYRQCNGYIMKSTERVFFAGDTGYGQHFKEIGRLHAPLDAAILPIGGYAPRCFMQKRHLNPAEALEAFTDLGARYMIPIHHGTFKLSTEKMTQPAEWLVRLSCERGLAEKLRIPKSGEKIILA